MKRSKTGGQKERINERKKGRKGERKKDKRKK